MKTTPLLSAVLATCAAVGEEVRTPRAVGDEAYGFRVREIRELPDLNGRMWRMEYVSNGADLVWIETEDKNKTFAVAFKTLPEDNTGVAHITEHSVLCGSEKFPVKEPFVELLKSSLATFINASTGSDVTVYPVCSRNDRDLLNLAEVYLDAVFAPLSVRNSWAMPQERTVVFNEMKGAMSSPMRLAYREISRQLFPSNTYAFNSGGDLAVIPTLTEEKYRAFYNRFYHPSNARIFIYGKVDVAPLLNLLGSYLGRFPRREPLAAVPLQTPVSSERTIDYQCDAVADRTRLCEGWAFGTWRDVEKNDAMEIVCDLLAGSNDAPLKKALLDAGVCEDFELSCIDGYQNRIFAAFVNVRDGRLDEARRIFRGTLERLVSDGLDRERIAAKLDRLEFRLRERDTSQPGLNCLWTSLGSWLYGGDPAARIEFSKRIESLRRHNGTGYYERLVSETILENPHHATLVMRPTDAPKDQVAEPASAEKAPADDPAALARLPRLRVADIPEKCDFPTWEVSQVDGVEVVRPLVAYNGITYATLAFAVDDLTESEMLDLPLLAAALGHVAAGGRDVPTLRRELESRLGGFGASADALEGGSRFMVSTSFLESHAEDALRLVGDILFASDFSSAKELDDIRGQKAIDFENGLLHAGHVAARTRASRSLSLCGRAEEFFDGITQYRHLKDGSHGDIAKLAAKVFVKGRLTASVANPPSADFARRFVGLVPEGGPSGRAAAPFVRVAAVSDGFSTKGRGAFTAMCAKLPDGVDYSGALKVAAKILSLDFLWKEIRVKGGAYGGSVSASRFGDLQFLSWRDPHPVDSFGVFTRCAEALREFVKSGRSFENYQVSVVGKTEPNLSVRGEARMAFESHLCGVSSADRQRERSEMLHMTSGDLLRFADILDQVLPGATRCAVGEEALIKASGLPEADAAASR